MKILHAFFITGLTVLVTGCQFESQTPLLEVLSELDADIYPENITVIGDGAITDICTRGSQNIYDCRNPDPDDQGGEILLEYRAFASDDPAERLGYYILQNPPSDQENQTTYYYWVSPAASKNGVAFAVMLPEADDTIKVTTRDELLAKADDLAQEAITEGLDWRMTSNVFVRETKPDDYRWFGQEMQHYFLQAEIYSDIEAMRTKYRK